MLAGCGYGFAVGGPQLPAGVDSVYVPVFLNDSGDAEAGALFADVLAESLARSGKAGGPSAPARIEGRVLRISAQPAATGPDGFGVGAYQLRGAVRLTLRRGTETLCVRELAGSELYLPAQDLLGLEASRREALRRLARKLLSDAANGLCPLL